MAHGFLSGEALLCLAFVLGWARPLSSASVARDDAEGGGKSPQGERPGTGARCQARAPALSRCSVMVPDGTTEESGLSLQGLRKCPFRIFRGV